MNLWLDKMRKTSQPTKHVFILHLTLPPIIMVQ